MNYQTVTSDSTHFDNVYGQAAGTLRNQLSFHYCRATGTEPSHWESRVYDNGLVVLAPIASTSEMQAQFDLVNLGEAFCKAIGRASEALAHVDEDSEVMQLLAEVSTEAEALAVSA